MSKLYFLVFTDNNLLSENEKLNNTNIICTICGTRLHKFLLMVQNACELYYRRPHKRGLEHRCLPLALTIAITPAVIPAQSAEET